MADPETPLPTDTELALLNVLWELGPSTVRQVADGLAASRTVGYTTVLKMLQVMHQKGLVKRDEAQRNHVYAAVAPRERTQERLVHDLMGRAFGNSAVRLMMRALGATRASQAERESIARLLERLDTEEQEESDELDP
ncbi:MAG TPA: BlaI/MecI/CopY family transcriptional regulator [Longimicrobium sp.]|nr:BlaI/MecI/CopY family transcriptional regulator [Longimicrobium sp.]